MYDIDDPIGDEKIKTKPCKVLRQISTRGKLIHK